MVSDKYIAPMNAINFVIPKSYNLLCCFDIDKNVKTSCKMLLHPREAWDQVMEVWGFVIDFNHVEAYERRL